MIRVPSPHTWGSLLLDHDHDDEDDVFPTWVGVY